MHEDDNSSKIIRPLIAKKDSNDSTYYIGRLQFNGTLSLSDGQSFMIFISDEGAEEIQIGPLPSLREEFAQEIHQQNEKISVRLKPKTDANGDKYYVGELIGDGQLNLAKGIFFTIFTSVKGREELQITPLKHKSRKFLYSPKKNAIKVSA